MKSFIGTGVALVTPFKKDFSVDVEALAKIVNYVIDGGVEYLVILGTTAESATLSSEEKELVINTIVTTNAGRLPLVLGVGGNDTLKVVEELKTRDLSPFKAILSVSPYYNKPTQEGIFQHFKMIADASPLPVILYNVPGRTSSNMLPTTVLRIANECKNVIGIKEAAGDIVQAMKLIQLLPKHFLVISGDDMITLPMVLAGGAGVISVIGEGFPKEFSEMVRLGLKRNVDEAYALHYTLMDSIDMIFEQGNPAGIKEVFKTLGLSKNTLRLPLVNVNEDLANRLESFTKQMTK
ncbi:4-hydroxy-tetrahydrodipicolinate synthase [Flavobacterium columnare NBRC 100251 = ATCC 23463]|uniref:4-hydroxy-tetrahydrodipicolinate synthase n=1 Tax=Flavobacterium columnare (strain ATCC 49512 / CIP 103533 / TG 44/87) TaxID=1041826 RepID=G8X610_FLACA|nr:4-hydroxy-tetrahydrodipicolinate synthase [Flavobacterium columnare]AEW86240.1 dihydrodipicolinate synthase [Flavobacterium columnare ATCC 49512]ANO48555.1 dihydrodipicolinate synthase [Flavobacterium columnare]APT23395.1 4-hydroxy-tetrahydrodipicolinate synthase [Flavobacterium columnare]MBF6652827.1 4-hydroxy-tetrahydrodipicolinate synthase [Flavobacterium columnare]OOB83635.1 4-hydroxy-tetrahydrodipicolinate synthase [Flavobacterium columnare]